jgi:SAM-dependent methyltransferase
VGVDGPDSGELWDRRFAEHAWPTEPDGLLVELVTPLAAGRALDVGSGPGRNSLWLAGRGWSVTAVDVSAVALTQANDRAAAEGVSIRTAREDVSAWVPPASSYDLVVLANLHFPQRDFAELLHRLAGSLQPGGHLFVIGHDLVNLGRHGPSDPELLLTTERLAAALPPELVVERLEQVRRQRDHPTGRARPDEVADVAVLAWASRPSS